jgi:hypothetical protein
MKDIVPIHLWMQKHENQKTYVEFEEREKKNEVSQPRKLQISQMTCFYSPKQG